MDSTTTESFDEALAKSQRRYDATTAAVAVVAAGMIARGISLGAKEEIGEHGGSTAWIVGGATLIGITAAMLWRR